MKQVKKAGIMDAGAVRRAVNRLSYEVVEKNHGAKEIVLVGIYTRGVLLAERIAQKIGEIEGTRPQVFAMDITAFRDDKPTAQPEVLQPIPAHEIEGKTVILVDDVLSTGRTVRAAMEGVLRIGRARRIQLAVLIDRGHRELPIRPDYIGKNLPTSAEEIVRVHLTEKDGCDEVLILQKKDTV
ncbi:MAG: bifunctional pyr operon transcriptional regulator/uracil phosphoribosyltransferase PyrR [Butyricicoccaceae bacterium]